MLDLFQPSSGISGRGLSSVSGCGREARDEEAAFWTGGARSQQGECGGMSDSTKQAGMSRLCKPLVPSFYRRAHPTRDVEP